MKKTILTSLIALPLCSSLALADDNTPTTQEDILQKMSMKFVDGMAEGFLAGFIQKHCGVLDSHSVVPVECATKLSELKETLTQISENEHAIAEDAKAYLKQLNDIYKNHNIEQNGNLDMFGNKITWESDPVTVSKYSVIPIPDRCPETARVKLSDVKKSDIIKVGNSNANLAVKLWVSKSPENKYWVVDSSVNCDSDSNACISSEYLTYKPKATLVVQCMEYRGLTVSMDKTGKITFESDIPSVQEAIQKANIDR